MCHRHHHHYRNHYDQNHCNFISCHQHQHCYQQHHLHHHNRHHYHHLPHHHHHLYFLTLSSFCTASCNLSSHISRSPSRCWTRLGRSRSRSRSKSWSSRSKKKGVGGSRSNIRSIGRISTKFQLPVKCIDLHLSALRKMWLDIKHIRKKHQYIEC